LDIDKLKSIDIVDFMLKNGYKQGRGRTGKWRSFYSPFGTEANASFKIDTNCNKFLDFSAGVLKKSSIIDLVMMLNKCSFGEACDILSGDEQLEVRHFEPKKQESGIKVHEARELSDKELIHYMTDIRCISMDVLQRFTKELVISFPFGTNPDKTYIVCGMQNMMKGWDMRNTFIKMASAPKSFTKIKGKDSSKALILEGFIDWLAYATYYDIEVPDCDVFVLNGLGQLQVLIPFIENREILFMLDNDKPADNALKSLDGLNIRDMRYLYSFYKDFGEFICDL